MDPVTAMQIYFNQLGIGSNVGISFGGVPPTLRITRNPRCTDFMWSQAQQVVATFPNRALVQRTLIDLYTSVKALTASQLSNCLAALTAGSPPMYLTSDGINAGAILAMDWAIRSAGVTGAPLNEARYRMLAMYIQDNPFALVVPSFDPTINLWAVV